jgi:hypothetical protein
MRRLGGFLLQMKYDFAGPRQADGASLSLDGAGIGFQVFRVVL